MAYAAAASLSQTINLILSYHQHSISPLFKNQITSLHEHISFLQSFLEDFPDEADTWEERIREVANVAEDIIELLLSDLLLGSTVGSSKPKFKRGKYELRHDFDELERVKKEIDSIAKGVKERHREAVGGFDDDDLTEIISQLCGGSSELEAISIVGVGGIGKTTLARNAYNHPLIVEHFYIRAWATVSQDFSKREIILGLLGSMNKLNALNISDFEGELLKNILGHGRYLVVLDDVWSQEAWDTLPELFPDDRNGSKIMLTTRSIDVASRVSSHWNIHRMRFMGVDQSWNLLRQKIFKGEPCPPKLAYLGKMIARDCRGLPLAIEVVSGILAANQTEAMWEDIVENAKNATTYDQMPWYFQDYEVVFLQIFHLSYTYLPHHMRPCFLYLAIFPEYHEIRVSKLIKLWVAEGILDESGSKSLEETGEEYLEDLVKRSLVSVSKRNSNGRIKSVGIHDLVRDMCIRQAHADNFFLHIRRFLPAEAIHLQRRVSIFDCVYDYLKNAYSSTIRTIICMDGGRGGFQYSLGCFRLLRILDLSNAYDFFNKCALPDEVFELFHLRYLALDYPFSISEAISNLENLQTLIICPRNCRDFVMLPVEIWRMPQLRHLVVHSCVLPSQEEEAMFALENLQTLSKAADFICSRETLKMIPNLKKLGISYAVWRNGGEDYELHNLMYLQKLEVLKIETHNTPTKQHRIEQQQRISPAFPPTLKKLSLSGLRLPWEDMRIVGSLPNLQVLKLRNRACIGGTWETNEGGFSQLTSLLIDKSDLKHWTTESSHFPRLKCLVLRYCWDLNEIPDELGRVPTLELIEVDGWSKSLLDSAERIREDSQSLGNDFLQIRVVRKSL